MVSNTECREQTKPYATFSDSSGMTVTSKTSPAPQHQVNEDMFQGGNRRRNCKTVQRPKNTEYSMKWALDGLDIDAFFSDFQ